MPDQTSLPAKYRLSKSRLLAALQCPKRLYLAVHRPELEEVDGQLQSRFDAGHAVGAVARSFHPEGRLIGHENDLAAALAETRAALAGEGDLTLFEPAFEHGGALVRADVFVRRDGRQRLIEVKASTSVKDYHLQDAAIQAWVIEGAGYPLDAVSLAHVDNAFVYPGGGDYRGLLQSVDVTQDIEPLKAEVPPLIMQCRQLLAGTEPQIPVGKQCGEPYACPFLAYCDRDAPEYPLTILGRQWRVRDRLLEQGYRDLRDVPEDAIGDGLARRLWSATLNGIMYVDPAAAAALRELDYPRYYLDFETIQFAVPIWAGTRPYEALPFQWSCHVEHADGRLEHRAFLDTTGEAPMRACLAALIDAVGDSGPVFSYTGYERRILREGARRDASLAPGLDAITNRLVDLAEITRRHYYHPAQKGSWSLKAVLPTIAPELDYATLGEVADGTAAAEAYRELIDAATTSARRKVLVRSLEVYCRRDTEGMVAIARRLCA